MNNIEKFDNVKSELYNLEQMQDINNNPAVKTTIMAITKSVPIFNTLIDSFIETYLTRFQQKKRDELLDIILSDSQNITLEKVNDVEFIMNFSKILEAVNRLSTNEKVEYFANVIKNGYFSEEKISNNEFDEYFFALSTLSYRQINILIDFYYHDKNFCKNNDEESKNKLQGRSEHWDKFINEVTLKYSVSEDDVVSILSSISRTGFCKEITGATYNYKGGIFYITNSCERFVKMILSKS